MSLIPNFDPNAANITDVDATTGMAIDPLAGQNQKVPDPSGPGPAVATQPFQPDAPVSNGPAAGPVSNGPGAMPWESQGPAADAPLSGPAQTVVQAQPGPAQTVVQAQPGPAINAGPTPGPAINAGPTPGTAGMPSGLPANRPAPPAAAGPTPGTEVAVAGPASGGIMAGAGQGTGAIEQAMASGDIMAAMAAAGNEGLSLGYGAFPTVKLSNGEFSDTEGNSLGTQFYCITFQSERKWIYKCQEGQDAPEFFYSKDGTTTTAGALIADVLGEWAAKGWTKPIKRMYLDIPAVLLDWDQDDSGQWIPKRGRMVLLQIPETSNSRYSGHLVSVFTGQRIEGRIRTQSDVITHVFKGKKVQARFPFDPWNFGVFGNVADFPTL